MLDIQTIQLYTINKDTGSFLFNQYYEDEEEKQAEIDFNKEVNKYHSSNLRVKITLCEIGERIIKEYDSDFEHC